MAVEREGIIRIMILEIVKYPDIRLKKRAEEVQSIAQVEKLIEDMTETMYAAPGVGLAAPQVGISLRVAVVDPSPPDKKNPIVLINPDIIRREGEAGIEEGCLSLPGPRAMITRAEKIYVTALDIQGKPVEKEAEGLLAIIIQHEIDHLNGQLFIDHLSRLKREAILHEYEKGVLSQTSHSFRGL